MPIDLSHSASHSITGAFVATCRVPRECPAEVETLIGRCLDTTPEKRPDTREIVSILQDLQEGEPPQEVGRILSA